MNTLVNAIRRMKEKQREERCIKAGVSFTPFNQVILESFDQTNAKLDQAQLKHYGVVTNAVDIDGKKHLNVLGSLIPHPIQIR